MDTFIPDLVIKDTKGTPVAAIEVKSRYNLPVDAATEIRRNMLARGLPARIPYFLLLSQDEGYLWKSSGNADPDAPPTYHFPMTSVIHRYSPKKTGATAV